MVFDSDLSQKETAERSRYEIVWLKNLAAELESEGQSTCDFHLNDHGYVLKAFQAKLV